jgi:NAD-dependent SIR2 family protein deacetylase
MDCKKIATREFFEKENDLYWEWNNEFVKRVRSKKSNICHEWIEKL